MSASVIQPMAAHREIYKIRSPGVSRRSQQNSVALGRVTRNLFGACDSKEIKTFVDRELAKANEIQSQKWGFDFTRGQPIANNRAQFQWEQLMTPNREEVPEMYTLTRIAHIRRTESFFSADEDSDAANSSDELQDTRARRSNEYRPYEDEVVTRSRKIPTSSVLMSPPPSAQSGLSSDSDMETRTRRQTTVPTAPRTRQARITEFLQERKKRSVATTTTTKATRKRSPSSSSHQSPVAKRLRVSIPGRSVQ